MSKRFRDTGLWDKDWYVGLTCAERCALDYIFCRCDPVGVWAPAFNIANKMIGEKVDWDSLPSKVNGNIVVLDDGKWWLADFCKYQYGTIHADSESGVQKSLYTLLVQHGLWSAYLATLQPRVQPSVAPTLQEKEKEKEKVKARVGPSRENVVRVVDYLNTATGRRFNADCKATFRLVAARFHAGHTFDDFKAVIDHKVKQWGDDPKMSEYLRPETLFGTKFDSYLATAQAKNKPVPKPVAGPVYDDEYYRETGKLRVLK